MNFMKSNPNQPVREFLLEITRQLSANDCSTVEFAAPFDTDGGSVVYIKYRLTVLDIIDIGPKDELEAERSGLN